MDTLLSMSDHFAVKQSLTNLDNEKLTDLGGALGLSYPKLRRMPNILDGMVAAWLRREDDVLRESGEPTWTSLVEALEEIGQWGVAEDIKKIKSSFERPPITNSWRSRWYILIALSSLLGILLLYLAWPSIMYKFNLYHSKSLPYLDECFVGREREMQEVLNLVDFSNSRVRIVNIIGSPGFGKSTLVIHVGHEVVKKGDVVHYVNLADFPDTDVKLVLAEKILDSARIVAKDVTFERALRWARERYYNNLLILDNCDDVLNSSSEMGEFQDAMKKLVEQSKNIKIIVTSRKLVPSLNFYEWVRVDKLNDAAAYKLIELKVESKVNLTQEEKEELAKHTGNVPLALQIVGSLLRLPSAPTRTPRTVISELQENPMKILTSPVFPADEQIFTTISLSYNYLSKEAKEVGRQLSVFPGSFTQDAALKICRSDSVAETLSKLVWNSLLEHNKRNNRYQYHRLIREYFLYVQKMEHSNFSFAGYTRLQLSFQVYYARMLRTESWQYNSEQFDKSLSFLDSELHNIKYILQENHLSFLPMREFIVTAVALSEGIELLTARFSKVDLCTALRVSLSRLDSLIKSDFQHKRTLPRIRWSPIVEDALWFTKEEILSHFMLIIDRVAACEEEANGIVAAGWVYMQRQQIVEDRIADIKLSQYKNFYTTLSNYYLEQGYTQGVVFCHKLMLKRTNAHFVKCERRNQCNYYDIGVIYFDIEEYQIAAEFLERWLLMLVGNNCLERMKVLIKLIQTYDALNEHEKLALTRHDLLELQEEILNTDYNTVQNLLSQSDLMNFNHFCLNITA